MVQDLCLRNAAAHSRSVFPSQWTLSRESLTHMPRCQHVILDLIKVKNWGYLLQESTNGMQSGNPNSTITGKYSQCAVKEPKFCRTHLPWRGRLVCATSDPIHEVCIPCDSQLLPDEVILAPETVSTLRICLSLETFSFSADFPRVCHSNAGQPLQLVQRNGYPLGSFLVWYYPHETSPGSCGFRQF